MSVFGTKADITLTECPLLGIVELQQCPSRHIGGLLHKTSHRQFHRRRQSDRDHHPHSRGQLQMTEQAIYAFFIGAAVGSILTYWYATREKRIIAEVRSRIETLGHFHDLTKAEHQKIIFNDVASNDEILAFYQWGQLVKREVKHLKKLDPIAVAAEAISEKLLGRTRHDAIKALLQAKSADDYRTLLPRKTSVD
jgi:hypothetical protein